MIPYIRSCFVSKPKISFFFEANVILAGIYEYDYQWVDDTYIYTHPNIVVKPGLGFAYGCKLSVGYGFVVEAFVGYGFYFT